MFQAALKFTVIAVLAVPLSVLPQGAFAGGASPKLVVPTDFPTIQSAIDAVKPGGTVTVLAGTYTEQLAIAKNVTLVGAGMDTTIIRAPATLDPSPLGSPAIVSIYDGARVLISGPHVRGPAAGACGSADVLRWGIRVDPGSNLELAYSAVREIHNTPMELCPRSGTAISVGSFTPGSPPAGLRIHHSEVTNFQQTGIIVLGEGSSA